jgi:hypothetical protein
LRHGKVYCLHKKSVDYSAKLQPTDYAEKDIMYYSSHNIQIIATIIAKIDQPLK